MAEGPAEGEWEEDAGTGAAAAAHRREMAKEREKAKQLEETAPQQKVINPSLKRKKLLLYFNNFWECVFFSSIII